MLKIFIIVICVNLSQSQQIETDRFHQKLHVIATEGDIWPKPKQQSVSEKYSIVRPAVFTFKSINYSCDILQNAELRYINLIRDLERKFQYTENKSDNVNERNSNIHSFLDTLEINLTKPCSLMPQLDMTEAYILVHKNGVATLESVAIWGILRGLESFSQMLVLNEDQQSLRFNETEIHDEPKFPHRGLLIDTSRHYLSVKTIYHILDGMAYNKLNVLHWHIVDDHSFPYESKTFPELSAKGAYHPTLTYTQLNISNIVEYARLRGIRVMPEFDTPGHTKSWGLSHPEILSRCYNKIEQIIGPMDPSVKRTYKIMQKLFREIVKVFPEKYIHLGGDEVDVECWENKKTRCFMRKQHISTLNELKGYYFQNISNKVTQLNGSSVVWQEIFTDGIRLPKSTVVQVWLGNRNKLLYSITREGYRVLTSEGWYLNYYEGINDWIKFYNIDPHTFGGTQQQKDLVLGGEACMWGELYDDTNIMPFIFPRLSAVAERLWSHDIFIYKKYFDYTRRRLEEHTCRLTFRGIPSQPLNGPGFCI